ncbi:MAG TPA: phosphodiesterase [Burkholderiales bacterium]|nr:phosphodiesterase [Burkholderiales bacterium]
MKPFLLAQVSDLHVRAGGQLAYGRVDTTAMFRRCVERLLALAQRPDAVALTGDLVDLARPEEYAVLRELLAPLSMPIYMIPGNHDSREALRAAFPEHAYLRQSPDFVQYVIDDHPLRIVAIDTVIPGHSAGELCETRLAWLERTLAAAPDRATLVLMHHPPFQAFITHMDRIALRDPERFERVIARHPQVELIVCGHVHRPITKRFGGTLVWAAPSCAHQIELDLSDSPGGFVMEPPAFMLHAYSREAGLVTHMAYVDDYPGPYRFSGSYGS